MERGKKEILTVLRTSTPCGLRSSRRCADADCGWLQSSTEGNVGEDTLPQIGPLSEITPMDQTPR